MTEEMGADTDGQQVKPRLVLPRAGLACEVQLEAEGTRRDGIVGNPKGVMASTLALLEQAAPGLKVLSHLVSRTRAGGALLVGLLCAGAHRAPPFLHPSLSFCLCCSLTM